MKVNVTPVLKIKKFDIFIVFTVSTIIDTPFSHISLIINN